MQRLESLLGTPGLFWRIRGGFQEGVTGWLRPEVGFS